MLARLLLFAPHEQARFRSPSGQRIQRRLMRAFVEKLGQSFFLRTANVYGFAIDDLPDIRQRVVHVADENRLGWTDYDTRGLETDVDAMRAEVTFLSRMIFGVDENRVVGAGGHAGFAADAN